MSNVLVTGASTGIGRATALLLSEYGMTVYAGVRRDADGESLSASASGELIPVRLDVTSGDDIGAVVDRIEVQAGRQS